MSEKWVPDTQELASSVHQVHSKFQDIVASELKQSLEFQNEAIDSLRGAEKEAATTTTQITRQLNNPAIDEIENEAAEIEALLNNVESRLKDCVDLIVNIDTELPQPQRLLAAQFPRNLEFPLLHQQIRKNSLRKTPVLLSAHRSKAASSVCNDHAVNTEKSLPRDTQLN